MSDGAKGGQSRTWWKLRGSLWCELALMEGPGLPEAMILRTVGSSVKYHPVGAEG